MRQILAKYAVIVQIVAILLLQFYAIAPHAGSILLTSQCRGDHAECGCAPERIAARSCCCYQHKPACCAKESGHGEEHLAGGGEDDSSPRLSSAPCGGSPKFIAASLDKLKFLRPESLLPTRAAGFLSSYRSLRQTALSRCTEPPEHPPKLSIAA